MINKIILNKKKNFSFLKYSNNKLLIFNKSNKIILYKKFFYFFIKLKNFKKKKIIYKFINI